MKNLDAELPPIPHSATIAVRNRQCDWPRHLAANRQNRSQRVVERDNRIDRTLKLPDKGGRRLDAADNCASAGTLHELVGSRI